MHQDTKRRACLTMIKLLLALSARAGFATALAVDQSGCSLRLTAGSGPVGQAANGHVKAGASMEATTFDLRGGQLVDSHGRACGWTPLLQCGDGQKPDNGFTVECDGAVRYNNQTAFHECGTGEQGHHDIYLEHRDVDCAPATLKADSCAQADCLTPPPVTATKTCPADLGGPFEFPHLIVPVDKSQPNRAAGMSYIGLVSPAVSSLFNFDIPSSDMGKSCSLVFLFPQQSRGETFPPTAASTGQLQFTALRSAASENSTYSTKPAEERALLKVTAVPGHNYTIDSFACPAGQKITIEMSAAAPINLKYFQDYNPSPIGLYITKC